MFVLLLEPVPVQDQATAQGSVEFSPTPLPGREVAVNISHSPLGLSDSCLFFLP